MNKTLLTAINVLTLIFCHQMLCFQALWKTLRNPHDSIAHVAFRVLGKFGGGNRRMLKEPQKVGTGHSLAHKSLSDPRIRSGNCILFELSA